MPLMEPLVKMAPQVAGPRYLLANVLGMFPTGSLVDLTIEAEPEAFRIRFVSRHRRGPVAFDWEGRIEGGADGRIVYTLDGTAGTTFLRAVCVPSTPTAVRLMDGAAVVAVEPTWMVPARLPREAGVGEMVAVKLQLPPGTTVNGRGAQVPFCTRNRGALAPPTVNDVT